MDQLKSQSLTNYLLLVNNISRFKIVQVLQVVAHIYDDTTLFCHMPFCHTPIAIVDLPYADSPYRSQFAICADSPYDDDDFIAYLT